MFIWFLLHGRSLCTFFLFSIKYGFTWPFTQRPQLSWKWGCMVQLCWVPCAEKMKFVHLVTSLSRHVRVLFILLLRFCLFIHFSIGVCKSSQRWMSVVCKSPCKARSSMLKTDFSPYALSYMHNCKDEQIPIKRMDSKANVGCSPKQVQLWCCYWIVFSWTRMSPMTLISIHAQSYYAWLLSACLL